MVEEKYTWRFSQKFVVLEQFFGLLATLHTGVSRSEMINFKKSETQSLSISDSKADTVFRGKV